MKNQKRYQKAVDEFVRRVLEKYRNKIERIILFGSVARGEAKEDSDVDILVIGDVSLEELVDISFPILLEHRKLISAKNVKREHFDFFVHEEYSFARNILREGIILYERVGEAFGESKGEAKSANLLFENDMLADAISEAYYSMFHAAKALLALRDIYPKTHAGVVSQFGLQFVNQGLI